MGLVPVLMAAQVWVGQLVVLVVPVVLQQAVVAKRT